MLSFISLLIGRAKSINYGIGLFFLSDSRLFVSLGFISFDFSDLESIAIAIGDFFVSLSFFLSLSSRLAGLILFCSRCSFNSFFFCFSLLCLSLLSYSLLYFSLFSLRLLYLRLLFLILLYLRFLCLRVLCLRVLYLRVLCLRVLCLRVFFCSVVLHVGTQIISDVGFLCCFGRSLRFCCRCLILFLFFFVRFFWGIRRCVFKALFGNLFLQAFWDLVDERLLLINGGTLATLSDIIVSLHHNWFDVSLWICRDFCADFFAHFKVREFNSLVFFAAPIFPFARVFPILILFAPLGSNFSGNIIGFLLDCLIGVEVDFRFHKLCFADFSCSWGWFLRWDKLTIFCPFDIGFWRICRNFPGVVFSTNLSHCYSNSLSLNLLNFSLKIIYHSIIQASLNLDPFH